MNFQGLPNSPEGDQVGDEVPTDSQNEACKHMQHGSDNGTTSHATEGDAHAPSAAQDQPAAQKRVQEKKQVQVPKRALRDDPPLIKTGLAVALQSASHQTGTGMGRPRCAPDFTFVW